MIFGILKKELYICTSQKGTKKLKGGVEQLVARWAHIRQLPDTSSSLVPETKVLKKLNVRN